MTTLSRGEITQCLRLIEQGDRSAIDRLLPHVYKDLRGLAGGIFRERVHERTLQPTALVHEAYMRMVKPETPSWNDRKHFLSVAAVAMRQLLTDYVRARAAGKRLPPGQQVLLDEQTPLTEGGGGIQLEALDAALTKLQALNERQARIVELRFLTGLSIDETADVLGIAPRTVSLDWKMARSWLQREIDGARGG